MLNLSLESEKIYKAEYLLDDVKYFRYFKTYNEQDTFIDVITNEIFKFDNILLIENYIFVDHLKYIKKHYLKNKNFNIFKINSEDYQVKNLHYLKLIRFFELNSYNDIFDPVCDKTILDKVIKKIEKCCKHYLGKESSLIYAEQLKKYDNLIDVLSLFPSELIEKVNFFWIDFFKNQNYLIKFKCSFLEQIDLCNKYDLKINDINSDILNNLAIKYDEESDIIFNNNVKNLILNKIQDARITLGEELSFAKTSNDNELIFEIFTIGEELNNIEQNLDNLDFNLPINEWWPELLYPIMTNEYESLYLERYVKNENFYNDILKMNLIVLIYI
jgi:hypothetical protein